MHCHAPHTAAASYINQNSFTCPTLRALRTPAQNHCPQYPPGSPALLQRLAFLSHLSFLLLRLPFSFNFPPSSYPLLRPSSQSVVSWLFFLRVRFFAAQPGLGKGKGKGKKSGLIVKHLCWWCCCWWWCWFCPTLGPMQFCN